MNKKIVPDFEDKNPYYIVAGRYTNQSAGIKVLHFLCHHLNIMGYPAYILNISGQSLFCEIDGGYTNPDLVTPILTKEQFYIHERENKVPITIYPDFVRGNPLRSLCIARYLLHYPGHLGGDKEENFNESDFIFSYSKKIKDSLTKFDSDVLFMPICNTEIFNEGGAVEKRSGSCFYASKYQAYHGGELMDITRDSIEITRGKIDSQTPQQIANLFRKSEIFYSYEDTSLVTEALLCGCPVIFINNKYFKSEALAVHELGTYGTKMSDQDVNLEKMKYEIKDAQKKFFESIEDFWLQFEVFIKKTQEFSFNRMRSSKLRIRKTVPIGRRVKIFLRGG